MFLSLFVKIAKTYLGIQPIICRNIKMKLELPVVINWNTIMKPI